MTTVKFDKSVKYEGVRYSAHEAFQVKDSDVPELKKRGATVLATRLDGNEKPHTEQSDESNNKVETTESKEDVAKIREILLDYSVPQLTKFAKERNINLQGKTRKADIYNTIVAAL